MKLISRLVDRIVTPIQKLLQKESGQDLIEYALVAALVGLAAIASLRTLSSGISSAFNSISSALTSAV